MKQLVYAILVAMVLMLGLSVLNQANAQGLPESVQKQSRKDRVESETWKKFDKSGQVKFLQLDDTAPVSAAGSGEKLDGSAGERLIEIKVDPAITADKVEWKLANKGKSDIWVVAVSKSDATLPVKIAPEGSVTLQTTLENGYCYIVVDNEGGKKATLSVTAKCGDVDAKTTEGNPMSVVWL
jgi:hypothetical protein